MIVCTQPRSVSKRVAEEMGGEYPLIGLATPDLDVLYLVELSGEVYYTIHS